MNQLRTLTIILSCTTFCLIAQSCSPSAPELESQGKVAFAAGDYNKACDRYQQALGVTPIESPQYIPCVLALYKSYCLSNNRGTAESLLLDTGKTVSEKFGDDSAQHFALLEELAHFYHANKRMADGERIALAGIKIGKSLYGLNDPRMERVIETLIATSCAGGKCLDMEPYWTALLDIREKTLGAQNPETVMTRFQLAEILQKKKKYGRAEVMFKDILESRRKDDTQVMMVPPTLIALGRLMRDEGKYDLARNYLQEAIKLEKNPALIQTGSSTAEQMLKSLPGGSK